MFFYKLNRLGQMKLYIVNKKAERCRTVLLMLDLIFDKFSAVSDMS